MSAPPLNAVTIGGWPKADALSGSLGNGTWKSRLLEDRSGCANKSLRRSVPAGQTYDVGSTVESGDDWRLAEG